MSAPLAVLAGLALFTGAGAGVIGLLGVPRHDESDPPHAGWCVLSGAALAGFLLYLPLAIDGRLPRAAFLVVFCLCFVLAAGPGRALVRRVGVARFLGLDLLRALPLWLRVATAALVLLAASVAFLPLGGWDERAIYGVKARVLFHEGSVRGEAFTDTGVVHAQPRYPLLVPLLEAALFTLQGSADDRSPRLLFVLLGLALVLVVAGETRRLGGPRSGALWGFLLLSTPMVISPLEGRGMTAYADLPLAAFVTGATVLLGRGLGRPEPRGALLAGLLLGAALATKQEGALWAGAIGLAFPLALRRRPPGTAASLARGAAATVVPVCLFLAASVAARRWTPPAAWSEAYAAALRLDWLGQLGGRPLGIAPFVLGQLADWKEWGWGWPLLAAGLVFLRRPPLPPGPVFWRATAALVLVADVGIFVVTPNHVHWHLATAFSRLLLQLFPLALLILAEQVSASGWPRRAPS